MSEVAQVQREPFANPPARLVVLSVEYPELPRVATFEGRLRQAFREDFPVFEQTQETRLTVGLGPGQTAQQQVVSFPTFRTRDRDTSVAVTPRRLVVETRHYPGLDEYLEMIAAPLGRVEEVLEPDGVTAIGHRFIDEVHLPAGSDADLEPWFDPALLAVPMLPEEPAQSWQAVVSYQWDATSRLTLRYGPLETSLVPSLDGRMIVFNDPVIGLDWDSHWAPDVVPEFTTQTIVERVAAMYAPVRSLFHRICTDRLRGLFGDQPREDQR